MDIYEIILKSLFYSYLLVLPLYAFLLLHFTVTDESIKLIVIDIF